VTVTLTDVRAASLHRATEAILNSRYLYSSRRLSFYFLSIDALRTRGLGAPCYAFNNKERLPLLDLAELTKLDAHAAAAMPSSNDPPIDSER
jgi:hypothetical protein